MGLLFYATCALGQNIFAQGASNSLLSSWLAAQTNLHSWKADFTQTRRLKALTTPLIATGHVWFEAPNRFRWEIVKPSPSMAIRQTDTLWVLYPRLKRAEKFPLNGASSGQWKDTLALLDAGFPRSEADIESRFNIVSQNTSDGVHELTLQPKTESARRLMPEIKIGFYTNNFLLRETVLQFADGSTMENVFTNGEINPTLDSSLFTPDLSGYKVTEPLKKQ